MRTSWLALIPALLAAAPAWADARLKLVSDRPVVIVVNMLPHAVAERSPVEIDFKSGHEGVQRVTVRNLAGQEMWAGTVLVGQGDLVTAKWGPNGFEIIDRKPLRTDPRSSGGGKPKQKAGHKTLDDLAATASLEDQDRYRTNVLDLVGGDAPDEVLAPPPEPGQAPAVAEVAPAPEGASSGSSHASNERVERKVLAADDGPRATVRLVPMSDSWANVWVDGARVWEYRAASDVLELVIDPGAHEIAVKDFRDKDTWGSGTLTVDADGTTSVHFSKTQPLDVRGGTWRPAP